MAIKKTTAKAKPAPKAKAPKTPAKKAPVKNPKAKAKAAPLLDSVEKKTRNKKDLYASFNMANPDNKHLKVVAFINEYCIDKNGTQAAIRAGYSPRAAQQQASDLLLNPVIKKHIDEKLAEIAKRNDFDQDKVLKKWLEVLNADIRDYVTLRVSCCRHCWGFDHKYQYTKNEMIDARERHIETEMVKKSMNPAHNEAEFDERGGDGFLRAKAPNPECPECCGEGHHRIVFKDMDALDNPFIFKGAKIGKDGTEIFLADKEKALESLSKHFNFYKDDNKVIVEVTNSEDLDAYYEEQFEKLMERNKKVTGREARVAVFTKKGGG